MADTERARRLRKNETWAEKLMWRWLRDRRHVCRSGRENLVATFALVSSLFRPWEFCNGMIDVMDKHFQQELHLTLAQSASVQFAHYLGYFLMALPASWLAARLDY